jgi:phosphate transport system protein
MPTSTNGFPERIATLQAQLAAQGRAAQRLLEAAFDAGFARDTSAAKAAIDLDEQIDSTDVEIERAAVDLLSEAVAAGAVLTPDQLRRVLTIVKVNNELERIADAGVTIGELVPGLTAQKVALPETIRVMTNSVIGILRDCCTAIDRNDGHLAKVVLASEDAILRDLQTQISSGKLPVDAAFLVQELATQCEVISGHCSNIAEQALYLATGKIVRHMSGHWQEVPIPPKAP